MANIREAFEYASQNPDSDFAKSLSQLASSGALNVEARKNGIDLSPFQPKPEPATPLKPTLLEKVGNFTGGTKMAQGIGQALAMPGTEKMMDQTQAQQQTLLKTALNQLKAKKASGGDTSRIEQAIEILTQDIQATGDNAASLYNPNNLTGKQIVGDALQLGTTLGTIGSVSGAGQARTLAGKTVPGLTKQGAGIATNLAGKLTGGGVGTIRGAAQGAIAGAGQGAITGGLMGVSQGLKQDLSTDEIMAQGGKGALIGSATGGVLGALVGGVSGRVQSSRMRQAILENQYATGEKIAPAASAVKDKANKIARQQGFSDIDIEFINSLRPKDKSQAQRMIALAQKATTDKRAIDRPIDIVGDSMVKRIDFIQKQNSAAGKAVDLAAKSLKGQTVDASAVREKALSLLEDVGVTVNKNGTANWSKSIFKKTPELQKKIMKSLSDLPTGEIDAYDLHNFKKSIDEVVSYGVGGEGLKGKSANILKAIRTSADDVLDTNFVDYNAANTDYKITKQVLDASNDLFGKKSGLSRERGGQLLRSVFSNNTQRPRVLSLIEQLDNTSKIYGGSFDDSLIDQALFTEILEDVYGTQATTSLQGQVGRAVKGTQKVIQGIRNPIQGVGEAVATAAEKAVGVSDENKRKILSALLR